MSTMISTKRRAKIIWQCRRGMLELDLMLGHFLQHHLDVLSEEQLLAFEHLLENTDPDLYAWLMGYETPAKKEFVEIVTYIRLHDKASSV